MNRLPRWRPLAMSETPCQNTIEWIRTSDTVARALRPHLEIAFRQSVECTRPDVEIASDLYDCMEEIVDANWPRWCDIPRPFRDLLEEIGALDTHTGNQTVAAIICRAAQ